MCAKDDLIRRKGPLLTSTQTRLAGELATAESVTAKDPNYVNTFSSDFAFSFANILSLIAFIISYRLFADKLRCLNKRHNDFVYLVNCFGWKHYNFNIHVSLATDTLHLLLKGLTGTEQKAIIQQLIAVVSLLFISKAPFALHFIRAVCDLVTLAQYKSYDEDTLAYIQGALERINIFKEKFRLILGIQPHLTKLPLSEVAANIAISNFTYAAAVCMSVQIHSSIKCWRSSSKRHNDSEHCNEEVLYLILIIIDYTCYDKDRKHIAYIRAFSEVLLFNNNRQINNTTRMLSMPFKFYDLSTIIRSVHLVPRDLPNSITYTTMSYYVNNYID
ncbi:hypothetical protein HBI07_219240 [Parastagonospora nodorum]|nr:hypothetical protein HBI07_219240 [Parastagonospora nodorum]